MEDNNVPSSDLEIAATTNDSVADQTTAASEKIESAPKKESVRDAVLRAMESTSRKDDKETPSWPSSKPVTPDANAKPVDPISGRELEPIKPPSSMTPALREKWGGLDRQMQQYWVDREKGISDKLSETAEERKLAGEFRSVASPYEAHFRTVGMSAPKYASELFNIDYQLRTGSPQQKAQIIHRMITQFNPDINALSAYARGHQPQVSSPAPQPLDVAQEVEKTIAARELAREQQAVDQSLSNFANDPKNEFYKDVREMMGKAVASGFVSGNTTDELFRNAYEFACQQHPGVKEALALRASQPQAVAKPVGSAKPSLGTGRSNSKGGDHKTTRSAVLAAWDKHNR